jgi:Putative DNA-binding domain
VLALRDLQLQLAEALFDGATDPVRSEIVANGLPVEERVDIYRNNLRVGYAKALAIAFPVIERLVGADYFRQLAGDLQRAHPSRAGNLHHIGAPFAAFLRERFADTEYAYLADVATLEWACEEALIAPDAQPISPDALRDIAPESYEHLCFELHPACALVKSAYPIVRIWRANQPEAAGDETIDLRDGGDSVVVIRTSEGIELACVSEGEHAALEAFARGLPLGIALEAAQAAEATFDLGAGLQRFFGMEILVGLGPVEQQ